MNGSEIIMNSTEADADYIFAKSSIRSFFQIGHIFILFAGCCVWSLNLSCIRVFKLDSITLYGG